MNNQESKIIKLVMALSGGRITTSKQAEKALVVACLAIIIVSLWFNFGLRGGEDEIYNSDIDPVTGEVINLGP